VQSPPQRPARPILPESERALLLAALECVDYVVLFDDLVPTPLLKRIRPDVHCKEADYAPPEGKPIPERASVEGYGGRVTFLPLLPGLSTSAWIRRIRRRRTLRIRPTAERPTLPGQDPFWRFVQGRRPPQHPGPLSRPAHPGPRRCDARSVPLGHGPPHLPAGPGRFLKQELLSQEDVLDAGRGLLSLLGCGSVRITCGAAGRFLFAPAAEPIHSPAQTREVFDVTGVGDTVAGTLFVALTAGANLEQAARLASRAAGIIVGRVGTVAVQFEDLRDR
jgi:bifunctional ADP-heptose synthase (sugar kinase/adenylyltransferase)